MNKTSQQWYNTGTVTNVNIELTSTIPFLQFARNKRHYNEGLLLQLWGI